MTKREEVAKELARELGAQVVSDVWRVPVDLTTHEYQHVPCAVRDALISREMRVRELGKALLQIKHGFMDCACEHDDENCCVRVGEYCPHCIAELALNSERKND